MSLAEKFLQGYFSLAHEYDPAARRERYLRTRKLKGRRPGSSTGDGGRRPAPSEPETPSRLPTARGKSKARQARVEAIQRRLDHLKEVLAELVEQAKVRSGAESDPQPDKKTAKAEPAKPKTTQQKKEDAERSREAYKKENPGSLSTQEKALRAEVQNVEQQIAQIRQQLKASVAKARSGKPKRKTQSAEQPQSKTPTDLEGRRH